MEEMPFTNLLEYTQYFLRMKDNIQELMDFASKRIINVNGIEFDYFDYYMMVTFYQPFSKRKDTWFSFSKNELENLLEDSFFSEYKKSINNHANTNSDCFSFLECYIYYKIQSISTNYLTYEESDLIAGNWLWNDKIEDIYSFGWYNIIANVYKNYGVHWFCDRKTDPILYKFAYYAIMSCKKTEMFPDAKIKQDLMQLYSELLISFAVRDATEQNKDIIDLVNDSVVNFDDAHVRELTSAIDSLKKERLELIDKNKQLTDGMTVLREQICELQKNMEYNDDKIEGIVYQIYCLSPQSSDYETRYEKFKSIWSKLSDTTKKDIKQSITMFEQFDSVDLAIFPLLRSLEQEFVRNFIQPFHQSSYYLELTEFICLKHKYQMTHNCLIKKGNEYPTIGSIPFIGRCVEMKDAMDSSNLLKRFADFLAEEKDEFCAICKNIDSYTIGSKNLKLINIRNGIAHGDLELAKIIDKQCYKDITTMLYEPPVRILFEIIENSKKGEQP